MWLLSILWEINHWRGNAIYQVWAGNGAHSDWVIWAEFNKGVTYKAGRWKTTSDSAAPGNSQHVGMSSYQSRGEEPPDSPPAEIQQGGILGKEYLEPALPSPYSLLQVPPSEESRWEWEGSPRDRTCLCAFRAGSRVKQAGWRVDWGTSGRYPAQMATALNKK